MQKVRKDGNQWKATRHGYIYIKDFEVYDDTLPPSPTGTGRLKNNAVPTIFKITPSSRYNIPEEAQSGWKCL